MPAGPTIGRCAAGSAAEARGCAFKEVTTLHTPVIMFLGRQDYTTPSSITAAWMTRLNAPAKATVWFEHSAHLPMIEEPGHVLAALLQYARPLADKPKVNRPS